MSGLCCCARGGGMYGCGGGGWKVAVASIPVGS